MMMDFLNMGGYGFYVWSAYGVTALAIVVELASLRARARAAEKLARMDKR
jgi:heme exporter protein D